MSTGGSYSKAYSRLPRPPKPVSGETRRVNIVGRTWTVNFEDGLVVYAEKGVEGLCRSRQQQIDISCHNGIIREQQRSTLLHELKHAIDYTLMSPDAASDEENQAVAFEVGWYHFLRHPDNKWAVDFILEKEKP